MSISKAFWLAVRITWAIPGLFMWALCLVMPSYTNHPAHWLWSVPLGITMLTSAIVLISPLGQRK